MAFVLWNLYRVPGKKIPKYPPSRIGVAVTGELDYRSTKNLSHLMWAGHRNISIVSCLDILCAP